MKKSIVLLSIFILVGVSITAKGQAPQKFSFQAVVRNSTNALVTNSSVGIRVSILQGSATGSNVYTETHAPSANANGLVTFEIGSGAVVSGNFGAIDWSNGIYFIKTETDPAGGTNYTITGTQQLLSVPYAQFSNASTTAQTATSVNATGINGVIPDDKLSVHLQDLADGTLTGSKVGTGINAASITTGTFPVNAIPNLDASKITTGTIDDARLSAHLQDLTDGTLTGSKVGSGINASNINTGTLAGSVIPDLDASKIITGTISDVRLSTHIQDLADGSLTGSKVGAGIDASNITVGTLPVARIPDDAINSSKIVDGSITTIDIGDGAITSAKISDGTVSNNDIGDGAINSVKIMNGTIIDADIHLSAAIQDSKLMHIATPGKVSGNAITSGTITGNTTIHTSSNIITTGGRIGVGTGTPSYSLHVTSSDSRSGYFENTSISGNPRGLVAGVIGNGGDEKIGVYGSAFGSGTTNIAVFGTAAGATTNWAGYFSNNVLILGALGLGVFTPTFKLELPNTASDIGGRGRANAWSTYSDSRVKSKQQTINYGLKEILLLRPKKYVHHTSDFKHGSLILSEGKETIGLVAQETYSIIPEAVTKPISEQSDLWSLDYNKLIPVLIRGMQEQQEQIEELSAIVQSLLKEKQQTLRDDRENKLADKKQLN